MTVEFLQSLYDNTILLRANSDQPKKGAYGWLSEGQVIRVNKELSIEQNTGLYGGPYKPLVGGTPASGLASIGAFSYSYSPLPSGIEVGRYCSISSGLKFVDSVHPLDKITTSAITFRPSNLLFRDYATENIAEYAKSFKASGEKPYPKIRHDVWVGADVTLSMGITIGTGAVIATGSTVTRDVPPYSIVGGNPAKLIRSRFPAEIVLRLLASDWWAFEPAAIFEDIQSPLESILENIENGGVPKLEISTLDLLAFSVT
ncbi:DapH/DapD/GlmU-related protein [Arthrobacter roseus]|uniref:DapH/DapD/GlmU-related protein n=1 Tax=Arthrobacter roseus TaxID=136274 RepID=UPI001963F14F|nr:acetyltransferase-like isoleucine patch superfamily enzyme [Arthrobacter roseus]